MAEKIEKVAVGALAFDCEIVCSEVSRSTWHVVLNGENKGIIGIDMCGMFYVNMHDGRGTDGDDWNLDSLRKAAVWAMRHLLTEEIEKGWQP